MTGERARNEHGKKVLQAWIPSVPQIEQPVISAVPSPSPTPAVSEWTLAALGLDLVIVVLALAAAGFLLVWAMLRTSDREPPAMVTVTLSLLTLVSIGGFIITESDILGTIAATGVGALAGAVTNLFDPAARRKRVTEGQAQPPDAVG